MEHERFKIILDELYDWRMSTSKVLENRGRHMKGETYGQDDPEGGAYPIVLASRPRAKICQNNSLCEYDKTYSRTSTGWREWCHECRKHYDHHNQETLDLIAEFEASKSTTNK